MSRVEGVENPENLFEAIAVCVKQPSLIGAVGAGGISGRKIVTQTMVAFFLLSFLFGLAVSWGMLGLSWFIFAGAFGTVLYAFMSLCATSFALYMVAQMSGASVTLKSLFTGLTFMRVFTQCLLLALSVVLVIPALTSPVSFQDVLTSVSFAYLALAIVVQIPYIMGVFGAGFLVSAFLSFIASGLASAILTMLEAMLGVA